MRLLAAQRARYALCSVLFGASLVMAGCGTSPGPAVGQQSGPVAVAAQSTAGIHQASLLLAKQLFAKIDKNGDGFLEQSEWIAANEPLAEFIKLDSSKIGRLTLTDFMGASVFATFQSQVTAATTRLFDQLDTNNDGIVSRTEFQLGLQQGNIDPGKMGLSMTAFDLADTNLNGYLTRSELENMVAFSVAEGFLDSSTPTGGSSPAPVGG